MAGAEANLDTQYAFGITHPTPGVFWSTGGSPPYDPDERYPYNKNEPYETVSFHISTRKLSTGNSPPVQWLEYILAQDNVPQTISTSYADDEQTGSCILCSSCLTF